VRLSDPIDSTQNLIHQAANDDGTRFYYVVETPGETLTHLYMVNLQGDTPSSPEWITGPVDRVGLVGWSGEVFYYRELDADDDAEVYRVDSSTWPPGEPQLLSSDQNSGTGVVWARISPDGTRLVYNREVSASEVYWYLLDLDQENPTPELLDGTALSVATSQFFWSPNSAHLVAELSQLTRLDLEGASSEGGAAVWEGPQDEVNDWVYSPDGDRLLLSVSSTSIDDHLFVADLTSTSPVGASLVTTSETPNYLSRLQWLPDSRFVAFLMNGQSGPYLGDFENLGAAPISLAEGASGVTGLQVSPFGSYVAFAADRDGLADMFVVPVDAQGTPGDVRLVSTDNALPLAGAYLDPNFLTDQWLLFYEADEEGDAQLFLAPVDGSQPTVPVSNPSHSPNEIAWLPDSP